MPPAFAICHAVCFLPLPPSTRYRYRGVAARRDALRRALRLALGSLAAALPLPVASCGFGCSSRDQRASVCISLWVVSLVWFAFWVARPAPVRFPHQIPSLLPEIQLQNRQRIQSKVFIPICSRFLPCDFQPQNSSLTFTFRDSCSSFQVACRLRYACALRTVTLCYVSCVFLRYMGYAKRRERRQCLSADKSSLVRRNQLAPTQRPPSTPALN